MRKRTICFIILAVFLILAATYFLLRKQKEVISCNEVKKMFAEYPLNFGEVDRADSCSSINNIFHTKDKLVFSADGVIARISKKEKKQSFMGPYKDREVSFQQVMYEETTISIWYSAKQQEGNKDIYARFMFEVDGYVIRGDIRGIYTQNDKVGMGELPEEIFDQTQTRILNFVKTYIAL